MIDELQVPEEHLGAFRRLVRKMPIEFQTDEAFLQALVMYLKLGGEKLASQRIEVEKAEFVTTFTLVKRQPIEDPGETDDETDEGADNDDDGQKEENDGEDALDRQDDIEDIDPDSIAS